MIDRTLYMWLRNVGKSQLAWSVDYGKTWKNADWSFSRSFGYSTLLKYGKNYRSARDEFVYIYSHDSPSAYKPADRMVLARVRKEQLRNRDGYEFFRSIGSDGNPVCT